MLRIDLSAFRAGLSAIAPTLLMVSLLTVNAQAQEAEATAEAAAAGTEAEAGAEATAEGEQTAKKRRMFLDEVVVTAQRRSEDQQDVPIAMTVMSGDDMRDAGLNQFNDLALVVPNVSINTDWFTLYIRGVGTSEVNVMAEQAVAYMIDGVYVSRVEFLRSGFLDVDQLEVLKGPQGVLFGRNSPAGVINITLGRPAYEWAGRASVQYGELEDLDARGMLNIPIVDDKVALRLSAAHSSRLGHTENTFRPGDTIGDRDQTSARAKLRFDLTDTFDITLSAAYFEYNFGTWARTEQFNTPAEFELLFRSHDPNFETELDRRGSEREGSHAIGDGYIASIDMNWEIWDHTISSVTSYAAYDDDSGGDTDGASFNLMEFGFANDFWQAAQELRLTSPPGTFEYVAGLFAFQSESDALGYGHILRDTDIALLQTLLLPDSLQALVNPVVNLLGGNQNIYDGDLVEADALLKTESYAVFGQLTWRITEDLALLAGGRYTYEKKDYHGILAARQPSPIWVPTMLGNGYDVTPVNSFKNFSPKVSATYAFNEEITVYATWAKGFRSGSFNIATFDEDNIIFDPEFSETYEAGVKTSFLGGLARFNLALFWTDYEDYQVTTFETITFESSNAEEVRVRGVEADLTISPFEGLVLLGSLGYNEGEYVKFTQASCPTLSVTQTGQGSCFLPQGPVNLPPDTFQDLSGQQLFRTPKWTGSLTAILMMPLGNTGLMGMVSANAAYRAEEFIDPDLDPVDKNDAYWLVGAKIGIKHPDNLWGFEVQVKNLTDELYKQTSFDAPLVPGAHIAQTNPPRQVLATFKFEF
ncbi:MAG: TonB-dependent receptor [Alphaproteobacteria bacterium]